MRNVEELAEKLCKSAMKKGADDAEVVITEADKLSIQARKGRIETFEQAETTAIGLRVFKNGAVALGSTRDLSEEAMDDLVDSTLELVQLTDPVDGLSLPERGFFGGFKGDLQLDDPHITALSWSTIMPG